MTELVRHCCSVTSKDLGKAGDNRSSCGFSLKMCSIQTKIFAKYIVAIDSFFTKANTVFPIFSHWTAWTQTLDLQFKYREQTAKQFTFSCKSTTSALSIWCTFCSEAITSDSGILNLNNWAGLEIAMPRIRLTCCCTGLQKQHFAKKTLLQNIFKIEWKFSEDWWARLMQTWLIFLHSSALKAFEA